MPKQGIRDLILFFAIAAVPIVSFWLQDYPDTPFYASMLVICLVVLLWLKQYHDDKSHSALVDFDENLHAEHLLWIGAGILATYFASSVIVSAFTPSTIHIPSHGLDIQWFNVFQVEGIFNDYLFQIVLVAPAEELSKLVVMLAFYLKLKGSLSQGLARLFSITAPIGFWAILHVYRNLDYQGQPIFLLSAFVGGLIIFGVMYKTKSLLSAILVHAGYNCLVLHLWASQMVVP